MPISHRQSRKWGRLSTEARGRRVRWADEGWLKYTPIKRMKRWFWGTPDTALEVFTHEGKGADTHLSTEL